MDATSTPAPTSPPSPLRAPDREDGTGRRLRRRRQERSTGRGRRSCRHEVGKRPEIGEKGGGWRRRVEDGRRRPRRGEPRVGEGQHPPPGNLTPFSIGVVLFILPCRRPLPSYPIQSGAGLARADRVSADRDALSPPVTSSFLPAPDTATTTALPSSPTPSKGDGRGRGAPEPTQTPPRGEGETGAGYATAARGGRRRGKGDRRQMTHGGGGGWRTATTGGERKATSRGGRTAAAGLAAAAALR
ncbi:hypothetical protein DAI22_07g129300 [Oryza sativa Japonica Group]|nr:hypothetical protein DAI22_07g129300 [Oryza sativa Japonica Group]